MSDRRMPIQDGPSVPYDVMVPFESQCQNNHGQSINRIAERGGFCCAEAWCVVSGSKWNDMLTTIGVEDAKRQWIGYAARINNHYDELDQLRADNERLCNALQLCESERNTALAVVKEDCEIDTLVRTEAAFVLPDSKVNGDSKGVPTLADVMAHVVNEVKQLRDRLAGAEKERDLALHDLKQLRDEMGCDGSDLPQLVAAWQKLTKEKDQAVAGCAVMKHVLIKLGGPSGGNDAEPLRAKYAQSLKPNPGQPLLDLLHEARTLLNAHEVTFRIPGAVPWSERRDKWNEAVKKVGL